MPTGKSNLTSAADLLQEQTLNSEKSIMDRHSPMLLFIQASLKRS